jgi:rhodanese-related sulfurtransferase
MVASLLKGMGFASVTVLKGGMKGWREAGLPVVK